MSFLRQPSQPVTTPTYTGLQLQTSSSAIPIPIVYGVNKIAPNIIWNGDFQAHYSNSGKGGGKGGGGSTGKNGGNQAPSSYTTALILGLCEGTIGDLLYCWDNSTISILPQVQTFSSPGWLNGDRAQPVWNYLQDNFPDQALSYAGTAIIIDYQVSMGSSATLDSYSFEIQGIQSYSGYNGYDADPAQVIDDFLTDPFHGVGFPSGSIATSTLFGNSGDASLETYCKAVGIAISPALSSQEAASQTLTRWLQIINCAAFWSEGLLKFVPYGDTQVTGALYSGGHIGFATNRTTNQSSSFTISPQQQTGTCTFVPNDTPIYDLTDDDFVAAEGDDPVQIDRVDPYLAYNRQDLEISQRSNFYDATPITAFDQAAIDKYGLRIAPTVTAHEICDPAIGQTAAQLILQRGLYIRNHYKFKLSWEYCLLEPMDLVTLYDESLGLAGTAVRIVAIEEDEQGLLSVTAEEFPPGVATAVEYFVQQKNSAALAANAPASAVNAPIIFEPPYGLADGLAVWVAVCGQVASTWGGCYVWASSDDVSYQKIGEVTGPSVMGVTTQDLPPVASLFDFGLPTVDTAHTLPVDISQSGGTLNPASQTDMLAGNSACFIGALSGAGEIIAYQNAVLTSGSKYNLSTLQRGAFDSTISDHPAGSTFCRLDGHIFKYPYLPGQIGQKVYLKFQSFNAFGAGVQDLADCGAYAYQITGSPLLAAVEPPQNLVMNFGQGQFAQLSWDEVTDARGTPRYQIWKGVSTEVAQQVGDVAHPPFNVLGKGTYYVRAYLIPLPQIGAIVSDFSAAITIAGALIVENNLAAFDEQAENWPGTLVNLVATGTSPNASLQLAGATGVDFGQVSVVATVSDDFGKVSDDVVIGNSITQPGRVSMDLGSLSASLA